MQVLVWISYGAATVVKAESPMDFEKIRLSLTKELQDWGVKEELGKLFEDLGTCLNPADAKRAVMKFVEPHLGTHETFEHFSFAQVAS